MKKTLWQEFARNTLISLGIYATLFLVLYIIEMLVPEWRGTLLRWSDADFLVGIPASLAGTIYILTIQNPKNYTGFVGAIAMAVFLTWQFALLGNWDLVVLHFALFIPFQCTSLVRWRRNALSLSLDTQPFLPSWLSRKGFLLNIVFTLLVVAIDYCILSWLHAGAFYEDITVKLLGGLMIASSVLGNFWMIYKKIDTWIWWIVYGVAGIVFYIITNNSFTLLMFLITVIIDIRAMISWIKSSQELKK